MNNHIVVAAVFIGAVGVFRYFSGVSSNSLTTILLGDYILLFILAIMDMFGGSLAQLASALAMLAVVYILLNQFPWSTVLGALQGKSV